MDQGDDSFNYNSEDPTKDLEDVELNIKHTAQPSDDTSESLPKEKDSGGPKSKKGKKKGKKGKKDEKTESTGAEGHGKFQGLKNKFLRKKKSQEKPVEVVIPVESTGTDSPYPRSDDNETPPKPGLDETIESHLSEVQTVDMQPGGYHINPSDTLTPAITRSEKMWSSYHKFMMAPPKKNFAGTVYNDEPIAELRQLLPKSYSPWSMTINVLLIVFFVIGIILVACGFFNNDLYIYGATFMGLSLFALIGKIFFTLFWEEDPLPRFSPYFHQMEDDLYYCCTVFCCYACRFRNPYGRPCCWCCTYCLYMDVAERQAPFQPQQVIIYPSNPNPNSAYVIDSEEMMYPEAPQVGGGYEPQGGGGYPQGAPGDDQPDEGYTVTDSD